MTDKRIQSNKVTAFFAGPDTAIDSWAGPGLTALRSLTNLSASCRFDGFDFNVQASPQGDDRAFTDAAGAQSRQFPAFGGSGSFFKPRDDDATGPYRVTRDLLGSGRPKLANVFRFGKGNTLSIDPGDEINVFHTQADNRADQRGESSMYYTVPLQPQDDILVNYVVPSAVPTAPVVTPSTVAAATVGVPVFLSVVYEGVNITTRATYATEDEAIALVTPHGVVIPKAVGNIDITVDYPGSAGPVTVPFAVTA
jgi:hypothetical protein